MTLQYPAVRVVETVVVHTGLEECAIHVESDGLEAPCHEQVMARLDYTIAEGKPTRGRAPVGEDVSHRRRVRCKEGPAEEYTKPPGPCLA